MRSLAKMPSPNDPVEQMIQGPDLQGWNFGGRNQQGHRWYEWQDTNGISHRVLTGSGLHGENAARQDSKMVAPRMRNCMAGNCFHAPEPQGIDTLDETALQPGAETHLVQPGQEVMFNNQEWQVYEVAGNLVGIYRITPQGQQEEELVPSAELAPTTASFSRKANILDPIHDTLAPEVWDNPGDPEPIFKPQHAKWLVGECVRIFHEGGYEGIEKHLSFVITGSLTTYQYSERSDVDTSLFVEFDAFPEWSRAEMIGLMVEELDEVKLPGTPYPLQIFVQPPEIKPEMIFKPGLRSGFSLDENRWLVPPDRTHVHDIEQEMHDVYTYALETADKMDRLLTYEPHKAVMFWDQLHRRRRTDQIAGKGDFSPSNVAYKMIVNRGLTDHLGEVMGQKIVL